MQTWTDFHPQKSCQRHPSWDSKQPANLSLFRPLRGSQEQGLLFHARPLQLCKYTQCFLKISQCSLATNCTPFQLPPLPMLYDGPTKFRENKSTIVCLSVVYLQCLCVRETIWTVHDTIFEISEFKFLATSL
jgi:hypothetical protein